MEMFGRIEYRGDLTLGVLQRMLMEGELAGIPEDSAVTVGVDSVEFLWDKETS